jgi:hypothetical protein
MHRPAFFGFARTVLTVVGIGLLIIFGVRAASQASSLAAVGGSEAKRSKLPIANINRLAATLGTITDQQQSFSVSQPAMDSSTSSPVSKKHGNLSIPIHTAKAVGSIENDVENVAADAGDHMIVKGPHVQ